MARYAEILPYPGREVDRAFTYALPAELRDIVQPGMQVLVPFGPRTVPGLVVELHDRPPEIAVKPVERALPEAPAVRPLALEMARWMAAQYWSPLGAALRCWLPEGGAWVVKGHLALTPDGLAATPAAVSSEHAEAGRALRLLLSADGRLALTALDRALGEKAAGRAVAWLRRRGLADTVYAPDPPAVASRLEQVVKPAHPPADLLAEAARIPARQAPRAALLRFLAEHPDPRPPAELAARAGVSRAVVSSLLKAGWLLAAERPVRRRPWGEPPIVADIERLTEGQRAALAAILAACGAGQAPVFLLHGVTASGKTEVFLRAAEWVVSQGRQVIVLVPEISLSSQALAMLQGRFGDQVAILHSALSAGERHDEWRRLESSEARVVVGARSAVFAPCRQVGLIVVDEEHESSYKQDHDPRYHAREVALELGRRHGAPVVLSSATPSLESYQAALEGRYRLLPLPERVDGRALPTTTVVDLRQARSRAVFSPLLTLGIKQATDQGQQVILFLNQRGYASFLLCADCGFVPRCPGCDISFTYHLTDRLLRCHHCGATAPPPVTCPSCGGRQVAFAGFGTERVEEELDRLLPGLRHARLDRDTAARKGAHARIVGGFRRQDTQVLIGTQMVAKGLDFPGVTLVGVLCADTALRLPDFRAGERTFQILTQVSGRAGRGEVPGQVIIQTFDPDHYAIQAAVAGDYHAFFEQEAAERRAQGFPPFAHMARLLVTGEDEPAVEKLAHDLAAALPPLAPPGGRVLGPAPAPLARLGSRYRWHLLVLAPTRNELLSWLQAAGVTPGRQQGASLVVDFDPVDTL